MSASSAHESPDPPCLALPVTSAELAVQIGSEGLTRTSPREHEQPLGRAARPLMPVLVRLGNAERLVAHRRWLWKTGSAAVRAYGRRGFG